MWGRNPRKGRDQILPSGNPASDSFGLPLGEAVVEEEVGEGVVEVRVVREDGVVLVRVGVLPEQDIGLLQGSTEMIKKIQFRLLN